MNVFEKLEYHRERAREELDLALAAQCNVAAEAHYRLSGLHLMTARELAPETIGHNVVALKPRAAMA